MPARIGILGPLVVTTDDEAIEVRGAKQRLLLKLLAADVGRAVPPDRLISTIWGDDATARTDHALQAQVSRLRKALAPLDDGAIVTEDGGYRLAVEPTTVDARRFSSLVSQGRRELSEERPADALVTLEEALDLWRGRPFHDHGDVPGLAAEVARLGEARRTALDLWADAALALGQHEEVLPRLEQRVRDEPLHERVWARLMLARYRTGRQAEALGAYRELADLLREQLGVDPTPEVRQLHERILAQDEDLAAPDRRGPTIPGAGRPDAPTQPVDVPAPLGSFVGRQDALEKAVDVLDAGRLVTYVGPGGAGKTRLAIEVVRGHLDRWPGGVWFVDVAPLDDGDLVDAVLATTLGVLGQSNRPPLDMVADALADRRALVILDNCEHVLDGAAATVRRLLSLCDQVQVLATSRVALGIPGEREHPVAPLEQPSDEDGQDLAALRTSPAVRLFVDRAEAAGSGFTLAAGNAEAVVRICRRLDGLPLAIELAAARVRALPLDTLAEQIGTGRFLTARDPAAPQRQRTLEALIGWSHDLLDDQQQEVFEACGVFAAPFTLGAAEVVVGDEQTDVVATLAELVERSLVLRGRDDGRRYRLLDTVRTYARDRLDERGLSGDLRDRHLDWAVHRAREVQEGFDGPEQLTWLARLRHELDDLRAAMDWATTTGRKVAGLTIASSLYRYWFMRGIREGRRWLDRLLALDGDVPPPVLAAALFADGSLRELQGHDEQAAAQLERSRRMFHELGAVRGAAHAGNVLARARWGRVPAGELRQLVEAVLAEFREIGDTPGTAITLIFVVLWEIEHGDPGAAVDVADHLLQRCEAIGSPQLIAHANEMTTSAAMAAGRPATVTAGERMARALELYGQVRNERCGAHGLSGAGLWLARIGCPEAAAVLQGAAEGARERLGTAPPRYEHPFGFGAVERAAALPAEVWQRHTDQGRRLRFAEAVDRGRVAIGEAVQGLAS